MPDFRETADQRLPQYTVGPGYNSIDDNTPKGKGSGWRPKNVIPAKQAVSKRQLRGAKGQSVIPVPLQAVSKRHPSEAQTPVIPAKAGIQGWWRGAITAFPRSTPPGFPLSRLCQNATPARHRPPNPSFPRNRPCQNCPLSLWERVGVREPRGKQAGVNGNEWERQGYWGPSPGLRPPSPRGRGVGFGTGRTGLRPPSPRGRGV